MTDGPRQGAQGSRQDVDLGMLEAAGEAIATGPGLSHMRTLAVFRDEELVFSRCFGPGTLDEPVHVHSVTKSVLSTLFGIALDDGVLPSLDVSVARYLPAGPGELPPALTLRHLLTMTRGTAVDGPADMNVVMEEPGPWLARILAAPRLDEPGASFRYDNAAAHLAALALDAALGGDLAGFARERLFAPLGITDVRWGTDSSGVPRGDGYLVISTRDLARLGELYRHGGAGAGRGSSPRPTSPPRRPPSRAAGRPRRRRTACCGGSSPARRRRASSPAATRASSCRSSRTSASWSC